MLGISFVPFRTPLSRAVLQGSYDPNFTAEMMRKDISLGLDLGRKYDVPQRINQLVADVYDEYAAANVTFLMTYGSRPPTPDRFPILDSSLADGAESDRTAAC